MGYDVTTLCRYEWAIPVLFEWDEKKNLSNQRKHGFPFEEAIAVFDGFVLSQADGRKNYGETRMIGIGLAGIVTLTVVYTEREDRVRIISARKANAKEKERYYHAYRHRGAH